MYNETKKVFKEVIRLSNFAFDEKYPAWISNSLTTIELTLKKTLNEIKQYENKTYLNKLFMKNLSRISRFYLK